jgi:hypothetical protein
MQLKLLTKEQIKVFFTTKGMEIFPHRFALKG